jgi:hypothetical protein
MNERRDPFNSAYEVPQFGTKPKTAKRPPDSATVEQIARDQNFPSRKAQRSSPLQKQRRHTTGRNQHIPVKATIATAERFKRLADERGITYGELLEIALDALDPVK